MRRQPQTGEGLGIVVKHLLHGLKSRTVSDARPFKPCVAFQTAFLGVTSVSDPVNVYSPGIVFRDVQGPTFHKLPLGTDNPSLVRR